MHIKSIVSSRW